MADWEISIPRYLPNSIVIRPISVSSQVQHGQDLDISKAKSASLVGVMASAQTVGKIGFGWLSDSPRVNRLYLYQACLLVCSVMSTLLPIFASFGSLLVYSIVFGLHDGCFVVHLAILTGDIAGRKNLVPAYGLLYLFSSLPMMLGPPVAGINTLHFSFSECLLVEHWVVN